MLQKNLSVLWALTDQGIVLQDLSTNAFYELDHIQEKIWALADGSHTATDITSMMVQEHPGMTQNDLTEKVQQTIDFLLQTSLLKQTSAHAKSRQTTVQ